MMNMLYRDPAEGDSLFGRALNICSTHEPAAQANKNRISVHRRPDPQGARRPPAAAASASRASAAARRARSRRCSRRRPSSAPASTSRSIDQEERAIAYCERTLGPLAAATGARIHYIRDGLRALLTRDSLADKLGARELIYWAGLFDYLEQRMFARITSVLYEALVPERPARHRQRRRAQPVALDDGVLLRVVPDPPHARSSSSASRAELAAAPRAGHGRGRAVGHQPVPARAPLGSAAASASG